MKFPFVSGDLLVPRLECFKSHVTELSSWMLVLSVTDDYFKVLASIPKFEWISGTSLYIYELNIEDFMLYSVHIFNKV